VFFYVLYNAKIMLFNVTMPRKSRIRPPKKREKSPDDSLRILASLIAQFHMKKINSNRAGLYQSEHNGMNNEQSLS
jgi:hypothetical protein